MIAKHKNFGRKDGQWSTGGRAGRSPLN